MEPSVYKNFKFGNTQVKYLYQGSILVWPDNESSYKREYFTIESKADNNTITLTIPARINGTANEAPTTTILNYVAYSTDKLNWTTTNVNNFYGNTISVTVNNGEKIYWKGSGMTYSHSLNTGAHSDSNFTSTGNYIVYGNIASLLYEDNFYNKSELPVVVKNPNQVFNWVPLYTYAGLFKNSDKLLNASHLYLPYTTLGRGCYTSMFYGCTNLTGVPDLSIATELSWGCFQNMFYNCTSITTPPAFPTAITSLWAECCNFMFYGCTNLVTPIAFPSTITVAYAGCCESMYEGCTGLTSVPILSATTVGHTSYQNMFRGCTRITAAPDLPATTIDYRCYLGMFLGCISLTSVPSTLPATTLFDASNNIDGRFCYEGMFLGCTSLTSVPSLPATTLAEGCYIGMFQDCTSLTSVPSTLLRATTLANRCYEDMFKGCTSLTKSVSLPASTAAESCYECMYENCTSLSTMYTISLYTSAKYCCRFMFKGCTSITSCSYLGSRTLSEQCYYQMFYGCSNLAYVRCDANDISASNCTANWLYGVKSRGTFVKGGSANWSSGASGIPSNWTVQ